MVFQWPKIDMASRKNIIASRVNKLRQRQNYCNQVKHVKADDKKCLPTRIFLVQDWILTLSYYITVNCSQLL